MDGLCIAQEHATHSICEASLIALVRHVLAQESRKVAYLGVVLTGRETVRALNRQYRSGDYDTDVLSFPLGAGEAIDGEIYVNLDFAAAHCAHYQATFEEEARRYIVHGLLHLMGYDDGDETGRRKMRGLEDRYLGQFAELFDNALDDRGTLHDVEMDTGHAVVK